MTAGQYNAYSRNERRWPIVDVIEDSGNDHKEAR